MTAINKTRITSIDLLRGIIMILMALQTKRVLQITLPADA